MRKLIVFLLFACCATFGQQTNSDIIPATSGLNLGHSNYRWNAFLNNLDITGTCTVNGVTCLGGGGSGSGIMITNVAGLATVPGKQNGTITVITNGLTANDCTVGGGTTNVACQFNGTSWSQLTAASSGATAFSAITGGINAAALQIGTGGSLAPTGSGTITATNVPVDTTSTANNFFTAYTAATGAYTKARPTCGNLSDSTALCTTTPGTGVATFLTTPSSANLFAALTSKTGSGGFVVFGTAPTISSAILSTAAQLSYITGSTQCLHVDTTGAITGTGLDCGVGGGGSLSGQSVLGIPIAATATTSTSSTTPGTNQGTYVVARQNTVQGAATSPIELQVGDCAAAGTVTGAGAAYTILYTDATGCNVIHDIAGSVPATITIPTPATLHNPAPIFVYSNYSASSDTLSPVSYSIGMGATAAGATITVASGIACKVQLDPVNAATWKADCHPMTTNFGAVSVNGSGVSAPNFNGSTPAAGAGFQNATIQNSGSNVSIEVPISTNPQLWLPMASLGEPVATWTNQTDGSANNLVCKSFSVATQITPAHVTADVAATSAGQTFNIGIYDNAGNLLKDSGSMSCSAGNAVTAALAGLTLTPGNTYGACVAISDTTCALIGATSVTAVSNIANKNVTRDFNCANALAAGAMPATCGVATPAATKSFLLLLEQ